MENVYLHLPLKFQPVNSDVIKSQSTESFRDRM
jgi:hypothetical protein